MALFGAGWTDQSGWRIRLLVFMVVVLGAIYVINLIFVTGMDLSVNNYSANGTNIPTQAPSAMQIFFGVLFFGYIPVPMLGMLLSMFTMVCWLVTGYCAYSFLKDVV